MQETLYWREEDEDPTDEDARGSRKKSYLCPPSRC